MNTLRAVFKFYTSRKFIFVEPGGNYGDHLIYRGAEKLAEEAEIDFESHTHREFMDTDFDDETVIYLHGSGGYNPWWSGTPMKELERAARTHEGVLIQGPSTVYIDRAFLEKQVQLPLEETSLGNMHFFTRERTSYRALEEVLPEWVDLGLDHDTALHFPGNDMPRTEGASGAHTFFAIRDDKESKTVIDHPKPFRMWYDPVPFSQSFEDWVRHHAQAREVVTNRLHSAVVSSILDKPVTLLPNSYHKNRSVYEFSLAEQGVEWQNEIQRTTLDRVLSAFPTRLQRSYRLARGINSIRGVLGGVIS